MQNPQGGGGPLLRSLSAFADQIAATARPCPRRVQRTGRHVTSFACATSPALASHRQRHLSTQNNVRRFHRMRVIGIRHIRAILPHIGVAESFLLKRSRKLLFIHSPIPPMCITSPRRRLRPPGGIGGHRRKGASVFRREDRYRLNFQTPGGGGAAPGPPLGPPWNPCLRFPKPPGPPSFTV